MSERRTLLDARSMPWRNGRGSTLELASDAPKSDADAWSWRLSIADVGASGPFSPFIGCDRHIAVVSGGSMHVRVDGEVKVIPTSGVALAFSGDASAEGLLGRGADGAERPVRDANLIVRRDRWRARFQLVDPAAAPLRFPGDLLIVHVLSGSVWVGEPLLAGETLIGTPCVLEPDLAAGSCRLLVATLDAVPRAEQLTEGA